MKKKLFSEIPYIEGERLTLRQITQEDAKGLEKMVHKISVGGRFCKECWGKSIAHDALQMMVKYLYEETDIEIITASSMIENKASARVLEKSGFSLVVHAAEEDWGFDKPTLADKWIRKRKSTGLLWYTEGSRQNEGNISRSDNRDCPGNVYTGRSFFISGYGEKTAAGTGE